MPPSSVSTRATAYDSDEPSSKRRNNGPLVAAIITALILGVLGFFFFQGRSEANTTEVDTVEVPISADEAREILRSTLNSENRLGDLANVAFAVGLSEYAVSFAWLLRQAASPAGLRRRP